MSDVESLKKQAKTYDEVHSIQAKVNHAIYKMIPTSTMEEEQKLKDTMKERDKKQWVHIAVVLPFIGDLRHEKDVTELGLIDANDEIEKQSKQIADLKEKYKKLDHENTATISSLVDVCTHEKELEGRLSKLQILYDNCMKDNLLPLQNAHGKAVLKIKGLEKRLQAIQKLFPQIKDAFVMLLRYSSKKNFILTATRLHTLRSAIDELAVLLGHKTIYEISKEGEAVLLKEGDC